jgi:hypothetical protein
LDDLYEVQYRQLPPRDVEGRIELARGCLQSELSAAAGRVIVELVQLAPDDLRVTNLERQLRQTVNRSAEVTDTGSPVKRDLPSPADLKGVAERISPSAFDSYMRHVQPMILNHCSASGCHGVASNSDFRLFRPLTGDRVTQRMTQSNLHAVLAQVDRNSPMDSPLLAAATTPHAHFAVPLVSEQTDRRELEMLKAWLRAVGEPSNDAPAESTGVKPPSMLLQPNSPPRALPPASPLTPAHSQRNSTPRDRRQAYEAEAFNRKFFPQRFTDEGPDLP